MPDEDPETITPTESGDSTETEGTSTETDGTEPTTEGGEGTTSEGGESTEEGGESGGSSATEPPAESGGNTTEESDPVPDPVTTFTIITPASGGGLGDKRVEIIKFDGTTGVVNFKSVPIFMCSDKGAVSYDASTGTVTVASAGATAMFVFKG